MNYSVGCLWQATVRFRRIFFFFADAKRQIWLTSNYILWKILWFSQAVACADSVVLEATCTSSGNNQKVRHFRKDCVSTLCVELNCENCKEFADHPFRFTHRTNEFTVYTACQTKQRVLQPNVRVHPIELRPINAKSKQATCCHTIIIPCSHDFHTRYSLKQCFQKSRTPSR